MRSRTPAGALASDDRYQVLRQSEPVDEPSTKSAEDPSLAGDPFSTGQAADDSRFEVKDSSPAVDEATDKVAEDPAAATWS